MIKIQNLNLTIGKDINLYSLEKLLWVGPKSQEKMQINLFALSTFDHSFLKLNRNLLILQFKFNLDFFKKIVSFPIVCFTFLIYATITSSNRKKRHGCCGFSG